MRISINNQYYYTDTEDFQNALNGFKIEGLSEYIQELERQADYTRQKLSTDLESYEAQLDDYNCMINDTIESLSKLIEDVEESKRINKDMILKVLNKTIKDINSIF